MPQILIYIDNLRIGGVTTVLKNYLNILAAEANYQVDLLVVNQPRDAVFDQLPANINKHYLCSHIEDEFNIYSFWRLREENITEENKAYFRFWRNAVREESKKRLLQYLNARAPYDFIINFNGDLETFLESYDLHRNTKVIRWIHIQNDIQTYSADPDYYRIVLDKQAAFVLLVEDMKTAFLRMAAHIGLKLDNKQVVVLYNPIETDAILAKANEADIADKALLEEDYILSVAGLYDYKNHSEMLDIYARLKQKGIRQKLYIIGEGYERAALTEKIDRLGLQQDCLLLGIRSNPFPFMKKAKLFIHTSTNEGLPTVFIESMVCGCPVVAMDCPVGPKEVLADNRYGRLVPLHDTDGFVQSAYELLTNETLRQDYIAGLPQAVARFQADRIGEQLFHVLTHIKNQATTAPPE